MTEKQKPAHKIRGPVGSGLTLTLWEHAGDKGPWYTATPSRSYKDGDQWKESHSFNHQDLLELAEMFREAHAWTKEQMRARSAPQSQGTEQPAHAEREAERETGRKRAGGRGQ
jgi:hypothetical protein